jgi:hypothetical protein
MIRYQGLPFASLIRQLEMNTRVPYFGRRDIHTQMKGHLPNHLLLNEPAGSGPEHAAHKLKPKSLW